MEPNQPQVERLVVLNNTPLTNFALVQRPDLIFSLWSSAACTTPAVLAEYERGVSSGKLPVDLWGKLMVVALTPQEIDFANQLPLRLGEGERTCLAVVRWRPGILVTDDLEARRVARSYQIALSGTLGILLACLNGGWLTLPDGNHLLAQMIAAGFHSPLDQLDTYLSP